jgi:hypothetical protein
MKPKKVSRKLILKKETISHLGSGEMDHLKGGWTAWECNTSIRIMICHYSICFCDTEYPYTCMTCTEAPTCQVC